MAAFWRNFYFTKWVKIRGAQSTISVGYASRQLPKNTDLPSIWVPKKTISFYDVSTPKVCSYVPTQKIDFRLPISPPPIAPPRWQRNTACLLGTCAAPSSHERVMLFRGAFEIGRLDKGLILFFGGWGVGRRKKRSSIKPLPLKLRTRMSEEGYEKKKREILAAKNSTEFFKHLSMNMFVDFFWCVWFFFIMGEIFYVLKFRLKMEMEIMFTV